MTAPGPRPARGRGPALPQRIRAPRRAGLGNELGKGELERRVSEILSRGPPELADDIIGVIGASKYVGRKPI